MFSGNRPLHAGDVAYYPDLFVVCGPRAHLLYETDATLVVEVRSATTAGRDRREKALVYATLPSLRCYLLVDPDRPAVDCGVRSDRFFSRTTAGPGDVVPTPYEPLVVDELYGPSKTRRSRRRPAGTAGAGRNRRAGKAEGATRIAVLP